MVNVELVRKPSNHIINPSKVKLSWIIKSMDKYQSIFADNLIGLAVSKITIKSLFAIAIISFRLSLKECLCFTKWRHLFALSL